MKNLQQEWLEKISQQRASGKSAAKWCREQNISYQTFLAWRKRLFPIEVTDRSSFTEIFENSSEPTWLEITTRGAKLLLAKKFNREALTRLIEVLREI